MATLIKNEASSLYPAGDQITLAIDNTSKNIDTEVTLEKGDSVKFYQIQYQGGTGAQFRLDGGDATSAGFQVADDFTAVWQVATLAASNWTRQGATSGTLVMQPLKA